MKEPQLLARIGGDYDATNNRVSCPQVYQRFVQPNMNNILMPREDEDCLYLNVFVPAVSSSLIFTLECLSRQDVSKVSFFMSGT